MSEKRELPQQKVPSGPDQPGHKDYENVSGDQGSIQDQQSDLTVRDTISSPEPPEQPTDRGSGETGS